MNCFPHGVYVFVQVGTLRLGLGAESVILENVDKVRYTSIWPHKGTRCYLACLSRVPAFFMNCKFRVIAFGYMFEYIVIMARQYLY